MNACGLQLFAQIFRATKRPGGIMKKNSRLILALDVESRDKANSIASETEGIFDAIKVGYPLMLSEGLSVIKELSNIAPVIADLKIADIPNTNHLICNRLFSAGAQGVIAHAFTGRDSLEACVDVAKRWSGDVYAVTEMSHPGALEFMAPVAERMVMLALVAGASGIVAPATRPERIRALRRAAGGLTIISPGVGAQGGSLRDALEAGADYAIVGRSVYESANPRAAAEALLDLI
ncbi:orotidine-5'-phosphate decarboxylase [Methanothrix thermoacetophila PT]|uniref:Orotidine 5'-phosphate decarboxylase n=2 Tax=Methanothrix TaxID=2222 RepID=A0B6U6_METTP|nr:orotidine-5'-phosphate decarboxylase [Methanothrix thermoacetophila PT]